MANPFLWLLGLPREKKRWLMVAADLIVLPFALWSAFILRFAQPFPPAMQSAWWLFLVIPLTGIFVFARLGLYRAVVRYMGWRAIASVSIGVTILAAVLFVGTLFTEAHTRASIPLLFAAVAFFYVGGSRFFVRAWYQMLTHARGRGAEPVIIFGAGVAGANLVVNLKAGGRFLPVAFVDEDRSLQGSLIDSIPVYGPDRIPELLEAFSVRRVLLAIPSASRRVRRRIVDLLEAYPAHVLTIPNMDEMVSGGLSINDLRDIDIGDLLGREPVPAVAELLAGSIRDRVVMISGAGGSIGSELCRKALLQRPKTLVLFERNEFGLYTIERELQALAQSRGIPANIVALLGSVSNSRRLKSVLQEFAVQTVYHAAAYKHVPIVEHNVLEGVENNVFATRVFAEAAAECGVERFVLISTDKAVRPTSVMGATKRLAELVLQDLASRQGMRTVFTMVRFGNVLGSSGSVVPLFHQQILDGGPVTVTHAEITRYFMTISEAAELVIQAGTMAVGGEVYVLDMGEPVRILDLARRMISLHGLRVRDGAHSHGEISIVFSGVRPGEKLFEELLIGTNASGTSHPKILRAEETFLQVSQLESYLRDLQAASANVDARRAYEVLRLAVHDFRPLGETTDWLRGIDAGTASVRKPMVVVDNRK